MQMIHLALLGSPVNKSLSPMVYGMLSEISGFLIHYSLLKCSPEGFHAMVLALLQNGYSGFNITLPYKEMAAGLFSDLSDVAKECGAANCVKFLPGEAQKNGIIAAQADNTDATALLWALRDRICGSGQKCSAANYPWLPSPVSAGEKEILKGKKAVILGSGGTARASAWALGKMGIGHVVFFARNNAKAQEISAKMGGFFPETHFSVQKMPQTSIESVDFFINATPLGMYGGNVSSNLYEKTALIVDWPYSADGTDFIISAGKKGIPAISGMELLLRQAVLNLRFWTGADISGMYEKAAKDLGICR